MAGNDWITWVGNGNYTIPQFVQESQAYGVSRRVGYPRLKQMMWGDWVYCIWRPKKKANKPHRSGMIFGRFLVDTITGLSENMMEQMAETFETKEGSPGGMVVSRECGDYVTGAMYTVKATLEDIGAIIENATDDDSRPMIGCNASRFEVLSTPWVHVHPSSMLFFRGFKRFNSAAFHDIWDEKQGQRAISIRHSFAAYKPKKRSSIPMEGNAEVVHDYKQLDRGGKMNSIQRRHTQALIGQLRSAELTEGNLTVRQERGILKMRWLAGGKEIVSMNLKVVDILGLRYDSSINSLVNILLGMLEKKRKSK